MSVRARRRLLLRPIVLTDSVQKVRLAAFEYRDPDARSKLSIVGIIQTSDRKFVVCHRRRSFLFTEICRTRDRSRRQRLFRLHARYLGRDERSRLSRELDLPNVHVNHHVDVIFPGGNRRRDEDAIECLLREIEEETSIERSRVSVSKKCLVSAIIYDQLIDRAFESVFLLCVVNLTSEQVRAAFVANAEVAALAFLDMDRADPSSMACRIIAYATMAEELAAT
ncbi:mRNA decapping enzyme [Eastern grey kangaroopox virus]|uniref:mRNA decapping enzyme n=1 Tax=Eastern grey kangaroopox virus TaxID=2042482 RepID=A0A2C9DT63_9POXV|nr:mRNA decapping enzyme [Eastern grey kangaroopox virus]ATI21196.1 mRNA decapping enzyme [Eastern grey kangaroopox virus]ATX75102.1 mRNA decapping enzyme [Eastern grey kangaroopox virus]